MGCQLETSTRAEDPSPIHSECPSKKSGISKSRGLWPAGKLVQCMFWKERLELKTFVNPKWPIVLYSSVWRRPSGDEWEWERLDCHLDLLSEVGRD